MKILEDNIGESHMTWSTGVFYIRKPQTQPMEEIIDMPDFIN